MDVVNLTLSVSLSLSVILGAKQRSFAAYIVNVQQIHCQLATAGSGANCWSAGTAWLALIWCRAIDTQTLSHPHTFVGCQGWANFLPSKAGTTLGSGPQQHLRIMHQNCQPHPPPMLAANIESNLNLQQPLDKRGHDNVATL